MSSNPKSTPGPGDLGPAPEYFEEPEYNCPVCGWLYRDEVEEGFCIICGEYVVDDGGTNDGNGNER